ncbi:hypothetical protein LPY66_14610 [Dehalobacter sp. DCM]|uniref:hypothetical protein n=1 Tax=Dehalobacter sp. DCM TaxID=2907827 RepID=UPI003081DDD4|nr:hypothetical protein LPY66_14610 [Dehalobacter sp. DCM]
MEKKMVLQELCDERHKALENYLSNERGKTDRCELEIKDVQEAIIRLTSLMEKHDSEITDHEERIRQIEGKPAKRWESLIAQLITLLTAAIAGGFIGQAF